MNPGLVSLESITSDVDRWVVDLFCIGLEGSEEGRCFSSRRLCRSRGDRFFHASTKCFTRDLEISSLVAVLLSIDEISIKKSTSSIFWVYGVE